MQLLDDLDRRVVCVGHAEQELEARVIELEKAAQVLLELLVESLERLENGHGRSMFYGMSAPPRDPEDASDSSQRRSHGHDRHQPQQQIGTFGGRHRLRNPHGGTDVRRHEEKYHPKVQQASKDARAANACPHSGLPVSPDQRRSGFIRSSILP